MLKKVILCPNPYRDAQLRIAKEAKRVLDEVVFLKDGEMVLHESVDTIREEHGKSVDMLFREVFALSLIHI